MYNTATRDDVKTLVKQIESLAQDLSDKLDAGQDFTLSASELVKNTNTMVFVLGEVFALEQTGLNKKVKAKVLNKNFHNVRDCRGRFVPKV